MQFLLYGADTFRSREYLRKLTEKFHIERDPQNLNIVTVQAAEAPERVIDELAAAPFLAEKRMVIVKNAFAPKSPKAKNLSAEAMGALDAMADFFSKPHEHLVAIFWEGAGKLSVHPLADRLLKESFTQKFDPLDGVRLVSWIQAAVQLRGAAISPAVAGQLAEIVGNDLYALDHALNQLCAAAQAVNAGHIITTELVNKFAPASLEATIFEVVDAIIARQPQAAYKKFHALWEVDPDPAFILSVLEKQLRILLSLHEYQKIHPGSSQKQIADEFGEHPFVIKKSLVVLSRLPAVKLLAWHRGLIDIDRKIKTGVVTPVPLFDRFIAWSATS
ncbi:MAG: DNA polymerase III subunit delta [Candidatus Magasanikbacteria bacterium]|nr:DNA polymerase III subunit delta [Candidatus Magasanikbacteria bacterium]